MSDKFNGFSQEEINRVSISKHKKLATVDAMKPATFRGHGGIRRMPDKSDNLPQQKIFHAKQHLPTAPNKGNFEKCKSTNKISEKPKISSNDSLEDINLDSSMSKSLEEALFYQPIKSRQQQHLDKVATSVTEKRMQSDGQEVRSTNNVDMHCTLASNENSSILKLSNEMDSSSSCSNSIDDSSILPSVPNCSQRNKEFMAPTSLKVESPFKGISLKDFESHRKMIEEQNRQKKEMLYKAIEQHSQKTAAEARKIEEIKAELAKLDNDLAVDVALLRKQIDNACIQFSNIEKHYMKIESQFLKAKLDLHNAAEKKELLTEHLCTVIAHNEDRKAQKLTELMEKVGLATNENYEPPATISK